MTITLSVATIVYLASSVAIVGSAVKIIFDAKKALTKPIMDMESRIAQHDRYLDNDKKHLDKIDGLIEELGDAVNLIVSADCVLLDHMATGNSTNEIDAKIKELDKWLVSRKEYKI